MITLPQAGKQTGKHEDTIRRLIKNLLKTDQQAKEKIKQEQTVRGFHYLIDEEYLLKHIQPLRQGLNNVEHQPMKNSHQAMYQPTLAEVKAKDETIAILKKQLDEKDEQIKTLLERSTETNILLKGYQDKYLLEAPQKKKEEKTVPNTEVRSPDKPVEKQPAAAKPTTIPEAKRKAATPQQKRANLLKKPEQKPKREKGFFSFLTGK